MGLTWRWRLRCWCQTKTEDDEFRSLVPTIDAPRDRHSPANYFNEKMLQIPTLTLTLSVGEFCK